MVVLFEQLRRWWQGDDAARPSDPRALAGKWPDTVQPMVKLLIQTCDLGSARAQQPPISVAPACSAAPISDADRNR
jgi:hypothetical protein